jgi:hypothetical protein
VSKPAFDPTSDCIASENQRRKKSANSNLKGRSKCLKVVLVKEVPCILPKGPLRERLIKMGRLKEVSFTRVMSECDCQDVLLDAFKAIGLKKFHYLQAQKNHSLQLAPNQMLDGNSVIILAGSGSLYLQEASGENTHGVTHLPASTAAQSPVRQLDHVGCLGWCTWSFCTNFLSATGSTC